jgi:hypothetical protein
VVMAVSPTLLQQLPLSASASASRSRMRCYPASVTRTISATRTGRSVTLLSIGTSVHGCRGFTARSGDNAAHGRAPRPCQHASRAGLAAR